MKSLFDHVQERIAAVEMAHDPTWARRVLTAYHRLRIRISPTADVEKLDYLVGQFLDALESHHVQ